MLIVITVILTRFRIIGACYIWGTDSGVCLKESANIEWRLSNMPFCARRINYPVCVPKTEVSYLQSFIE
jgi:hypothetical protein